MKLAGAKAGDRFGSCSLTGRGAWSVERGACCSSLKERARAWGIRDGGDFEMVAVLLREDGAECEAEEERR